MTYLSDVLAFSPFLQWDLDETSGTTAGDDSGNSRTGVYSGTFTLAHAPLVADGGKALDLTTSPGGVVTRSTVTGMPQSTFTGIIWANRNGNGHDGNGSGFLMGRDSTSAAFSSRAWLTYWNDDGTLTFRGFSGGAQKFLITTASAVTGAHMIAFVADVPNGAARIVVDGVTVGSTTFATGGSLTSVQSFTVGRAASQVSGGLRSFNGLVDAVSWIPTALTDAQLLALYSSGSPPAAAAAGSMSFSGSGGGAAAGAAAGALALSGAGAAQVTAAATGSVDLAGTGGTVAPSPATGTGAIALSGAGAVTAGLAGAGAISFDGSGTALGAAVAAGTGAIALTGSGAAAGASPAAGTGAIALTGAGSATLAAAGSGSITLGSVATAFALFVTDVSNALNGRRRRGRATAWVDRPAVSPGRTFGPRYDKALAYPAPTMVDGRPT